MEVRVATARRRWPRALAFPCRVSLPHGFAFVINDVDTNAETQPISPSQSERQDDARLPTTTTTEAWKAGARS